MLDKDRYPEYESDLAAWKHEHKFMETCGRCDNVGHYVCDKNPCRLWPAGTRHTHLCNCNKSGARIVRRQMEYEMRKAQ